MNKYLRLFSYTILILACLNVFAWSIIHVHEGGRRLGFMTEIIRGFYQFPSLVNDILEEIANPETLISIDPEFESNNHLTYDVYAVNAHFEESEWVIQLSNLRNDSSIFEWSIDDDAYFKTNREFSHAPPRLPIVLPDTSVVFAFDESMNLLRVGVDSKVIWHNKQHLFHHAINLDTIGNIWTCTKELVQLERYDLTYWDNFITLIDLENGGTLYHKSVSEILIENNLGYLIHGASNGVGYIGSDPIHLNEVEPILSDGPYWQKGDVFLSMRNRSIIVLFRPSNNKIIRVLQGPFFNQHDLDIINDSTVSFFNNNISSLRRYYGQDSSKQDTLLLPNSDLNLNAQVLVYQMNDSSYTSLYADQFRKHRILTFSQGLHHLLSNGDLFIESWDEGKVYLFNDHEMILKKYFNDPVDNRVQHPHWVRIYENLDFFGK